jgi:hypothetical protein
MVTARGDRKDRRIGAGAAMDDMFGSFGGREGCFGGAGPDPGPRRNLQYGHTYYIVNEKYVRPYFLKVREWSAFDGPPKNPFNHMNKKAIIDILAADMSLGAIAIAARPLPGSLDNTLWTTILKACRNPQTERRF